MAHEPAGMVVFTDVDGALRSTDTRSWSQARPALDQLVSRDVPVVLTSHHTAAELIALQSEVGICEPFVCESGGALYIPRGYFADLPGLGAFAGAWERVEFADRRAVVCEALYRAADALDVPVAGLSRLTVEQVAAHGRLSPHDAELAMQREFDEPFAVVGGSRDRTRLFAAMRRAGFRCFSAAGWHVATAVQDPGHAVRLLIALYRLACDEVLVVGIGSGWTGRAVLQEVDVPIIVRSHTADQERLLKRVPGAYVTAASGPAGWSEAILGAMAA